jgi:putative transposase
LVIRAYRFPLRPTAAQRAAFWSWLRQCCTLYNAALEQRITAWKKYGRSIGYAEQCRGLTDLREETEWGDGPVTIQRSALRRVDRGFQNFFRRCKAGEKPGHPRYRAFDRYDSFGIGRASVEPAEREGGSGYVYVPKIGRVRFKQHRMMHGDVRDVTIRRDARGRWFVQISCDVGATPPMRVVRLDRTTGIDLGLTHFAVLADGTKIANPRHFKRSSEVLAQRQRALVQKKRGSRTRRRARTLVARTHEHIANQRLDFHRKTALALVRRFDLIAHEDLNIRGLAGGMLAKSVYDVGWGQFIRILHCKAEEAGVYVIPVDPRGTTQICSACGRTVPKTLYERVHLCECGLVLGRDHNAALMVHARGLRAVLPAQAPEASF